MASDYLRKKAKEQAEKIEKKFGSDAYGGTTWLKKQRSKEEKEDDIAPVKTVTEEKAQDDSWFKGSALFDDGWQPGDVFKTAYQSVRDVSTNILGGFLDIGEAIVDAGAYVGGLGIKASQAVDPNHIFAPSWHNEETVGKISDFIKGDLYDGTEVVKSISNEDLVKQIIGVGTEEASVFGEKSDSLAQAGGQLAGRLAFSAIPGVGQVGGMALMATTAFGSEAESALNNGATFEEAGLSAAISAGAEILTEKLFGGSGLGEKGLINVDPLTRGISNKFFKALADYGVDLATEGSEEVAADLINNFASALYKEENPWELITNEEAIEGYIDSFIGGMALSGTMNSAKFVSSAKNGTDYRSELTKNEQKVVEKVYKDALAEKDGKISNSEKSKLWNEVVEKMGRGEISTDTIEEVLGDKTYKDYKTTIEAEESVMKELEELYEGDELQQQIDDILNNSNRFQIKNQLSNEVSELVKGDRLSESYNEKANRSRQFEADVTKYDPKHRDTIQKAIDSGILNNTRKTHEFVDIIAKISADKGVSFDFLNNQKLKEYGFAVDGKQVNGLVTESGISINIDSPKAWQSTVGHEITHVLEGTDMYDALQQTLFDYAKSRKGTDSKFDSEYKERLYNTRQLYKDVKGYEGVDGFTKIKNEVTADLVGDYLFTDEKFIKHLSAKNRNVFEKIYDEIKYLYKVATAGSKEARELEKVKKAFEDAYRAEGKAKGDTKYSISDSTAMEQSINDLRSEIETVNDDMMFAEGDEYRTLSNKLVKLNHELDKLLAQEQKATKKTPLKTVLDNLSQYRRSDLESLAEQVSEGAWDGYEDLSRAELEDGIREIIEEKGYSPIEMQNSKYGLWVRPVESAKYSISATDVMDSLYNYDTVKLDKVVVDWNLEYFEEQWEKGHYGSVVDTIAKQTGKSKQEVWNSFADILLKTDGIAKVDGKTYINVHELNEENLRKAFELGGLAAPSIGIVDVDSPTTHFGDIALIFPDIFNPSVDPTYYGDSYSSSFPAVGRFTDSIMLEDALTDGFDGMMWGGILSQEEIYDLVNELEQVYFYDDSQRTSHSISRDGFANAQEFARNYNIKSIPGLRKLYNGLSEQYDSYEAFLADFADKAFTNQRMHRTYTGSSDFDFDARRYQFKDYNLENVVDEMTSQGDKDFRMALGEKATDYNELMSPGMRARLKSGSQNFYEVKPQRAVYFDEASYAVVPENTSADVIEMLEYAGVKVVKYQRKDGFMGIAEGRAEAIKGILEKDTTGIRYSLSDSDGKKLTKEQQEYFKDSKMRDENGNLKVMYHGSKHAGFHVFDSQMSDDDISFFFTDSNEVASSYSRSKEVYEARTFHTAKDMNKFLAEIGYEDYEVVKSGGKYTLYYDVDEAVATSDNLKDLYDEFCDYAGVGEGEGNYKVYLNLKNPLVVDAEGRNWDNVSLEFYPELYEQWKNDYFTEEEKAALVDLAGWEDYSTFKAEVERAVRDANKSTADEYTKAINSAFWKHSDVSSLFSIASDNFSDDVLKAEALKQMDTRDYAQKAKAEGYDGVIFKNLVDIGEYGRGRTPSTVAIAFESNQIKSVANTSPTADADIRYSLSEQANAYQYNLDRGDMLGAEIAVEEYANLAMPDSKIRGEDGKLIPVYHGTHDMFYEFAPTEKGGKNGTAEGFGIYTSDDPEVTEVYGERQIKMFANITKPATSTQKTITASKLAALIKDTCKKQAQRMVDDGEYDSVKDALMDTWVSNYVYTYGIGMDRAYKEVANSILQMNDSDMSVIQEVMSGMAIREYGEAMDFYHNSLTPITGFDGFVTQWENSSTGKKANIYLAFDSSQLKSADAVTRDDNGKVIPLSERFNPEKADIRYSLSAEGKQSKQYGRYSTPATELRYEAPVQNIAPVAESVTVTEELFPDDLAPVTETTVTEYDAPAESKGVGANVNTIAEKKPVTVTRKALQQGIVDGIKSRFAENGIDFDEVLKKAKNLSTFSTVDNTPQRVMEKALGYKEGQILSDLTVNQVAQNETESIKWLNSFTNRKNGLLAQISKQYNIKPGSKESSAAQMYAEGFYVDEKNNIVQYGDAELAKDFPDAKVQQNIKGLANDPRIRQIYDETLAMINESRARNGYPEIPRLDNYFLHFRAMEDTFSRLGLPFNPNDIRAKDLPTDLNGVTADLKPGQPYFASAMHRTGKRTSFDLLGGLEKYLSSAKNQIFHIDDIQTLRALRNYVADTYGQANGLEGLDSLSEEEAQDRIAKVYNSHLSTFAKFLNEEANILAGKTSLIDRGLEGVIGRRGITFLDTVNKQVGSNMVGFNISSSLTNLLPVAQTFAKTNKADFVKAFGQTVANKVGSIFGRNDSFAENSPVVIRRKGADRFYRTPFQKAADAGYVFMSAVDDISTELIARTKYNELTRKGMDSQQAHYETDKWVSRLMGDRSLGQQPQLYNSKMLGLLTKFQLEVRNQLDSQFYDTIQETKASNEEIQNGLARNAKTAAKIASTFVQLAVVQHLFGKAFESVAGYNPAFDIIETLIKTFGWDDDEESEDTVLDNIEQGFFGLLEDLPYTSIFTGGRIPIESALPIEQLVTGKDKYGNEKSRWETLGEVAPYYLLPGGYGQIKKTYQGLDMFSEDYPIAGSYTDIGNLRFPVEDTLGNRLQAGIFGQYASSNARDYFDNDIAPLKEKQIQEFIDVGMTIQDYWDYREGLSGLNTLAEKADYINSLDLTTEQKNILINNIADRKEKIDMSTYGNYDSFDEFDFATKNPAKYVIAKSVGGYENFKTYSNKLNDIKSDKDGDGKSISGSRKEKVIDYVNGLDIDYGQKIILFKSEYKSDNTYNYDIVDYLNSRNDISYDEMVAILKELGFMVSSDGYVTW